MSSALLIAGTCIPTAAIWHFNEAGYDESGILEQYPSPTARDVEAALDAEPSGACGGRPKLKTL
jgi:uncharacterized protein (DUF433 family)